MIEGLIARTYAPELEEPVEFETMQGWVTLDTSQDFEALVASAADDDGDDTLAPPPPAAEEGAPDEDGEDSGTGFEGEDEEDTQVDLSAPEGAQADASSETSEGAAEDDAGLPPPPAVEEEQDAGPSADDSAAASSVSAPAEDSTDATEDQAQDDEEGATETGSEPAAASAAAEDGSAAGPEGEAGDTGLPAHLQLPTFPTFDMSFDQEEEEEPQAEDSAADEQQAAAEGGAASDGATEAEAPAGDGTPAHLAAAAGPPPLVPPKLPPKPKAAAPAAPAPQSAGLPDLPDLPNLPSFGGPGFEGPGARRDVELVRNTKAHEIASKVQEKSAWGIMVMGLLLIVGLAGAGYWQREMLLGLLGVQKKTDAKAQILDQVMAKLQEGSLAFDEKKWKVATNRYREALSIDEEGKSCPKKEECWVAQAHLRMAVSLATLKNQKEAVEHYRAFLEWAPDDPKAKGVKEIVANYEKAQAEKAKAAGTEEKKEEPQASADSGKKKKKKRRRRR